MGSVALIFGGTGSVGRAISCEFKRRGIHAIALSRSASPPYSFDVRNSANWSRDDWGEWIRRSELSSEKISIIVNAVRETDCDAVTPAEELALGSLVRLQLVITEKERERPLTVHFGSIAQLRDERSESTYTRSKDRSHKFARQNGVDLILHLPLIITPQPRKAPFFIRLLFTVDTPLTKLCIPCLTPEELGELVFDVIQWQKSRTSVCKPTTEVILAAKCLALPRVLNVKRKYSLKLFSKVFLHMLHLLPLRGEWGSRLKNWIAIVLGRNRNHYELANAAISIDSSLGHSMRSGKSLITPHPLRPEFSYARLQTEQM